MKTIRPSDLFITTQEFKTELVRTLYQRLNRYDLRGLPPLWEIPPACLIVIGQQKGVFDRSINPMGWCVTHANH